MKEKFNENTYFSKYLGQIYTEIFCKIEEQYIIVFLCGGASTKQHKSLRDKTRILLEKENKNYTSQLPLKIFYPEDLLVDILNKTKGADLLTYEQLLANNSHIIVIICESAGSLVELGAFTNNEFTVEKVIAAIDKKKAKNKSFIVLGPIKYLKKKNKLNVIEYGSDEVNFKKILFKNIQEKHSKKIKDRKIKLDTIVGMHYFIQLLLYYYKQVDYTILSNMLNTTAKNVNLEINNFNVLLNAALKLLFHDKQITKTTKYGKQVYELTEKGYQSITKIIRRCTNREICDSIRIGIMYQELYKSPHP